MQRVLLLLVVSLAAGAQVIEFESGGLKYQALTKNSVTVMFAHLPAHVREYTIVQVAVSNGAQLPVNIRPEDFTFERSDGTVIRATPAKDVVSGLIEKGSRGDVVKLVSAYEMALYGMTRLRPTNGYEARRQQYLAEVTNAKIKAAAAASAIALVQTKLGAGQSTDGAVFFTTEGKPLGPGRLMLHNSSGDFAFNSEDADQAKKF